MTDFVFYQSPCLLYEKVAAQNNMCVRRVRCTIICTVQCTTICTRRILKKNYDYVRYDVTHCACKKLLQAHASLCTRTDSTRFIIDPIMCNFCHHTNTINTNTGDRIVIEYVNNAKLQTYASITHICHAKTKVKNNECVRIVSPSNITSPAVSLAY